MGCYEGCEWVSLGGVGHVELSEVFFGFSCLKPILQRTVYENCFHFLVRLISKIYGLHGSF